MAPPQAGMAAFKSHSTSKIASALWRIQKEVIWLAYQARCIWMARTLKWDTCANVSLCVHNLDHVIPHGHISVCV